MKIINLSSGSKGNTTYVETNKSKLLIDLGNSSKYVKERLMELNVDPKDIDGILITHTHKDHIKGLEVFCKKYKTKVYITSKMLEELPYLSNYELINSSEFNINDIKIVVIKTSHDASDSNGYILYNDNKSLVYITDTGYINHKYFELLKDKNVYIMESNHDIEMLNNGSYPYELRKRIYGDKGHLSNVDCSKYLTNFIGDNTKYIVLAHLSEENNTPDIVKEEVSHTIKNIDNNLESIIICSQYEIEEINI